jgi:hypothetical protein
MKADVGYVILVSSDCNTITYYNFVLFSALDIFRLSRIIRTRILSVINLGAS